MSVTSGSRKRRYLWGSLLAVALCLGACPAPKATLDTPGRDVVEAEIYDILRKLFPKLSDDELHAVHAELDLSAILALRTELEAIRKEVVEFSDKLFETAEERVQERQETLAAHNDGFPTQPSAIAKACTYDTQAQHAQIQLSGVLNGKDTLALDATQLRVLVDAAPQTFSLSCNAGGPSVDIVFLIDITGSMSNVIAAVRDSVVRFVDVVANSGVRGTLSVVTFQDSVGVNRTFQESAPAKNYERSPFMAPAALGDNARIADLRAFVNRLEANRGADAPENLAAAIDFARNNVIGYTRAGAPNVIGDGVEDPVGTAKFPALTSERQVFVVFTDVTFHGESATPDNSSLLAPFVPRKTRAILETLQRTGTTVHVSDPSWVDETQDPARDEIDPDYWAAQTGGVGEDTVEGYSLTDLELVVVAKDSGLLDITLDRIIESSCKIDFDVDLRVDAKLELELNVGASSLRSTLSVQRL